MESARTSLMLSFLVFFLAGCAAEADDVVIEEIDGVTFVRNGSRIDSTFFPYEPVLEQTFGVLEEPLDATLSQIHAISVDSRGNVFVLDSRNMEILAFDPHGELRWSGGSKGDGPGEFTSVRGMTLVDDSLLYIGDGRGEYLEIWNTNGQFLSSNTVRGITRSLPSVIGVDPDGNVVLVSTDQGPPSAWVWLVSSSTFKVVDSLALSQEYPREVPRNIGIGIEVHLTRDRIVAPSATTEYFWKEYDFDLTWQRQISRGVDYLSGSGIFESGRSRGIMSLGGLERVFVLPDGMFMVYTRWSDIDDADTFAASFFENFPEEVPEWDRYAALDLFDKEGRFRNSLVWKGEYPSIGEPLLVDDRGFLYTRSDIPFPQVRRYRFERR